MARIHLHLELDAQSKKRLNTEAVDKQFVSQVAKALQEQGRQAPFRVPVAIRMHFHVGLERTPPQIHQLPKHYLDLLQTPISSRPSHLRPLLLQDDRLVEALFCSYSFADEEPSSPFMTFEVTTLTRFIRDLELHERIATGDFDEIDGVRELERVRVRVLRESAKSHSGTRDLSNHKCKWLPLRHCEIFVPGSGTEDQIGA